MSSKIYSEISTEKLQKQLKSTRFITGILIGVLIMLLVLNIFFDKKTFFGIIAVPMCLLPVVILNFNNINEMKKELKSRIN